MERRGREREALTSTVQEIHSPKLHYNARAHVSILVKVIFVGVSNAEWISIRASQKALPESYSRTSLVSCRFTCWQSGLFQFCLHLFLMKGGGEPSLLEEEKNLQYCVPFLSRFASPVQSFGILPL